MPEHTPNEHWSIVMPFVTVASKGGPYDDEAYCAGYEIGRLDAALARDNGVADVLVTVHTPNAPQVDLVAMRHGFVIAERIPDDSGEWTTLTLRRHREKTGA